jgi:ADP-heptose:LPS heptosyltransferase
VRATSRPRVLIARLDSMGDVLLTGGAVRAVAAEADVTLLVAKGRGEVARLLPGVSDVIEFDAPWVLFDPPAVHPPTICRLVELVRARRFAKALVCTSFHQSPLPLALLLRLAEIEWIGAISADYPGSLLDLRHAVPDELPEAERNASLAVAAGFHPDRDGARTLVVRPLPDVDRLVGVDPYVVCHPGAAVAARRPTAEHARTLVAGLVAAGHRVLVTGSAEESTLTGYAAGGRALDLGGRLGLRELAAVLDRADCVVAPNTGPAHLAAAVGTPVVSLFAPVVPAARWQPYGVPIRLLGDQQAPCRDSRARSCPVPGHPCLSSISPADVVSAVEALVDRTVRIPKGA